MYVSSLDVADAKIVIFQHNDILTNKSFVFLIKMYAL
jgi:hypothetical protein